MWLPQGRRWPSKPASCRRKTRGYQKHLVAGIPLSDAGMAGGHSLSFSPTHSPYTYTHTSCTRTHVPGMGTGACTGMEEALAAVWNVWRSYDVVGVESRCMHPPRIPRPREQRPCLVARRVLCPWAGRGRRALRSLHPLHTHLAALPPGIHTKLICHCTQPLCQREATHASLGYWEAHEARLGTPLFLTRIGDFFLAKRMEKLFSIYWKREQQKVFFNCAKMFGTSIVITGFNIVLPNMKIQQAYEVWDYSDYLRTFAICCDGIMCYCVVLWQWSTWSVYSA